MRLCTPVLRHKAEAQIRLSMLKTDKRALGGIKNGQKIASIINNAKIASNPSLQLSSPDRHTCSTMVFITTLWETTLLLHLLSLITKTRPKSKLVLQSTLILRLSCHNRLTQLVFGPTPTVFLEHEHHPLGLASSSGPCLGNRRVWQGQWGGRPRACDGCVRRWQQRRSPRAGNGRAPRQQQKWWCAMRGRG